MTYEIFLSNFTHITQWKMSAPKIFFYFDLKHVPKYGCAKFQPNPLFSSQQTATESAAEKKNKTKKKVGNPLRGSSQQTGYPNKVVLIQRWSYTQGDLEAKFHLHLMLPMHILVRVKI